MSQMDHQPREPGPTPEEVKNQFTISLKPILLNKIARSFTKVPQELVEDVNDIIDESIDLGVNEAHQPASSSGWGVFGLQQKCEDAIRRIYEVKLTNYKAKMGKKSRGLSSTAQDWRNPEKRSGQKMMMRDEIDQFLHGKSKSGGRRKKRRKIKGKYSLKKRKSIRKKKRPTRKL
tara:strand:- start:1004 stop:1528 length:525 start_codon:yes stop_codon:yes gene_type:complete